MTRLFIFISHGSILSTKMLPNAITSLNDPEILAISAHYEGDHWNIKGSSFLNLPAIYGDSQIAPMQVTLNGLFDLIKQTKKDYELKPGDVYLYCEANITEPMKLVISDQGLNIVKSVGPGTLVLFTSTVECRKFVHFWRDYHSYSRLGSSNEAETDHYDTKRLSGEKLAELDIYAQKMVLHPDIDPPMIDVVDKTQCVQSIHFLLKTFKSAQIKPEVSINTELSISPTPEALVTPEVLVTSEALVTPEVPITPEALINPRVSINPGALINPHAPLIKKPRTLTMRSHLFDFFGCCCNAAVVIPKKLSSLDDQDIQEQPDLVSDAGATLH